MGFPIQLGPTLSQVIDDVVLNSRCNIDDGLCVAPIKTYRPGMSSDECNQTFALETLQGGQLLWGQDSSKDH